MNTPFSLQDGLLTCETADLRCAWRLGADAPAPVSIAFRGREWLEVPADTADFPAWTVQDEQDGDLCLAAPNGARWRFRVHPSLPAVTCLPPEPADGATPLEWLCRSWNLRLHRFVLADQSDLHDNLFRHERHRLYPNERLAFTGNLFALEDPADRGGLVFLKHAPLPASRPAPPEWDLAATGRTLQFNRDGYAWTILPFTGGQPGLTAALQRFLHALKPCRDGLDGLLLSNTWGDRSRDTALSEAFLLREIDTAADLGVEVCQIDDGWEVGVSINSAEADAHGGGAWGKYYQGFWAIHPTRFPNGFAPLAERCRALGVGLGLWFSPDSDDDFAHWQEDARRILELHREYGVRWWKIDGITVPTRTAHDRLQRLFRETSGEADGGLAFDLDITAGQRPGYFGLDYPGAIFLENRYSDWHCWWPFATLRQLWLLARVLPPVWLRLELLNPDRNPQLYTGDPLAPARYTMDWLFASVMLASPLLWCEMQHLAPTRRRELKSIVPLWKQYRRELHHATVLPFGDEPDGYAWSAFAVRSDAATHILVFRDNAPASEARLALPVPLAGDIHTIAGNGTAAIDGTILHITLSSPRSFLWLRLTRP